MKYLRGLSTTNATADARYNLDVLAGEMVNIMTGTKYYDKTTLLDKPIPCYNTYTIGKVDYEIHPSIGCIILLQKINTVFKLADIRVAFNEALTKIFRKAGRYPPISAGILGTTQYMYIASNETYHPDHIMIRENIVPTSVNSLAPFTWCIFSDPTSDYFPLYVPYVTNLNMQSSERLLSFSSIIYDDKDVLRLPDGHMSADYPLIESYTSHQLKHICEKPIIISLISGIVREIARNFYPVDMKVELVHKIHENVFWLKWENVKPRKVIPGVIPYEKQIAVAGGKDLPYYDEDIIIEETKEIIPANADYRCVMTGVPIYEDCYVFDVYSQTVEEEIPIDDLYAAISKGAKLYVEPIVKKSKNTVDDKDVIGNKAQNASGKRGKKMTGKKTEPKKTARRAAEARRTIDRDIDTNVDSVQASAIARSDNDRHVKTTVDISDSKFPEKNGVTVDAAGNYLLDGVHINVRELPRKKGIAEPVKLVKIIRDIIYDEPVRLLISPFAMHCMTHSNHGADIFQQRTNSKVIIYRTFCPRTCADVIEKLICDNGNKTYRAVLQSLNTNITAPTERNVNGTYQTITGAMKYSLYNNITIASIIANTNNVIGMIADKYNTFADC